MAAAYTAHTSNPSSTPLESLTNEARPPQENFSAELPVREYASGQRKLRRTKSFQLQHDYAKSSEAGHSEHLSIFDAQPVFSEDDPDIAGDNWKPASVSLSRSFENSTNLSDNSTTIFQSHSNGHTRSISHSNWPEFRLDTIVEQNSISTLHASFSAPRLSSSPGKRAQVVSPEQSIRSLSVQKHSSWSQKMPIQSGYMRNQRSLSLNDLNCLWTHEPCHWPRDTHSTSSSTSTDVLQSVCICPAFPKQPAHPPPARIPTPPGLPTFGTPEAIRFRMPTPSAQHTVEVTFGSRETSLSPTSSGSLEMSPRSPPMDMFKRILGLARIVSPPPQESDQRVPLPPHVQALARAPDGTLVRGTFGNRTSGHGIGRRTLESHPLVVENEGRRREERNRTEEELRRIDKACEEVDRARTSQQTTQLGILSDIAFPRQTAAPYSQERASGSFVRSGVEQPGRIFRPHPALPYQPDSPANPRALALSPPQSCNPYLGLTSPRSNDVAGIREFIEQGERASAERARHRDEQDQERESCEKCLIWFCWCCCELDCDNNTTNMNARRVIMGSERGDQPTSGAGGVYLGSRETMRYRS